MIAGAILQASSYGVAQILVARIVLGIGMGFVSGSQSRRIDYYTREQALMPMSRSTQPSQS
jgi:MFS family permease